MTRPSKRAQVEALGWKLTVVPRHVAAGIIRDGRTGYVSPAFDDYRHPEAWVVTPPLDHPAAPRRFDGSNPSPAVRWAWDQAMAPRPAPGLVGVAALVALAAAAGKSGVVAEGGDAPASLPALPDAELLQLCGEIAGTLRIAEAAREGKACPWDQPDAFRAATARVSEASRARERLIPRVLELPATTPAGALAKAQVVAGLFRNSGGRRAAAVRSLVEDLAVVLDVDAGQVKAGGR